MKSCPQCKQTYLDDGLRFCLSDGVPLHEVYDPDATLIVDDSDATNASRIRFPLELFRVHCLFGYETGARRESELWNDPMAFHRLARERGSEFLKTYNSWRRGKRKFTRDELLDGSWVKVADHGHQHRLQLHDDGTLTEWSLFSFDDNDSWGGEWKLIDGVLRLNIQIYELDVVADINGFHSGVEDEHDNRNAYFSVIHVGA